METDEPSSPKAKRTSKKAKEAKKVRQTVHFKTYRISQAWYELIGKPTDRPPDDVDLDALDNNCYNGKLAARGGKVICTITEGQFIGIGVSICSYSDVFSRRTGRDFAYARAELALHHCKGLDLAPHVRAEVVIKPGH